MSKWQPKRAIERRYSRAITSLLNLLWKELRKAKTPAQIRQTIERFARSPTFTKAARAAALSMATQIWRGVATSWRTAASKSARGKVIYQALKTELDSTPAFWEIVNRNADYIKTMPLQAAEKVTTRMAKGYEAGKRPDELLKEVLAEAPHLSAKHARLIARTETSKASTALTRVRAEAANLDWYVWRTSKDERVRSSHEHMDGVLVSWNEPPSPEELDPRHEQRPYGEYHAGETFNCRCYPEPLLDYTDVAWPARVYHGGRLQRMTLAKFKTLTGGEL